MKGKGLIFIVAFLVIISSAVGATLLAENAKKSDQPGSSTDTTETATKTPVIVPQLDGEGREESATMVLVGAPPMMPDDHASFWNAETRHDSCLVCHDHPETGAPKPTPVHYYNDDPNDKIFRDYCVQCHATQNDSKTAFNE